MPPPSTPIIGRTAPSASMPDICFTDAPAISSCRTAPLPATTSASLLGEDLCGFGLEPPSTKPSQPTSDDWGISPEPLLWCGQSATALVDEWSGFEGAGRTLP